MSKAMTITATEWDRIFEEHARLIEEELDAPPVQLPQELVIPVAPTKWSTRLEGGCPACVAKHLSQAITLADRYMISGNSEDPQVWIQRAVILDHESRHGYPGHKRLAIGCLANAEMRSVAFQARQIREARLSYEKDNLSGLVIATEACGKVGDTIGRSTVVWAHIEEAIAELPHADGENRLALQNLYDIPWPAIDEKFVPEVSRILKNVVEIYEL